MYSHNQHTAAAALQAIAQAPSITAVPFTLAALEPAGEARPGSLGRRVRGAVRVARAVATLTLKRSPKWARVAAVACLAIPGPVDEIIVWPALVAYVAVRHWGELASVAREAWSQ
jgi:hypothetical protein